MIPEDVQKRLDKVAGMTTPKECRRLAELAAGAGGTIIELGSHSGLSTLWLALGSWHGNGWSVHACDPFPPPRPNSKDDALGLGNGVQAVFEQNLNDFEVQNVALHVMKSTELAEIWDIREPVGMVFIDAVHEEWAIREDFKAWHPFLKRGGILALHDYSATYPGTQRVVEEDVLPLRYQELHVPDQKSESLWVGRKPW